MNPRKAKTITGRSLSSVVKSFFTGLGLCSMASGRMWKSAIEMNIPPDSTFT